MSWWQILLFPFAILYDVVTRFRNHMYNIGSKPSFEFEANVIAVGNLGVGGTGKTPMVGYLIDHFLSKGCSVATLSRGYGRKTKGFRICGLADSPATVGDEPYTYYEKYQSQIMVTVGEDRAMAIPFILAEEPDLDVILLDDAFQHRSVKPSFNVLLTTFQKPFWKDFVLPAGRLREARKGASRADAIVVTKSDKKSSFVELEKYQKPVFQTKVSYGKPVAFFGAMDNKQIVTVAGLADNRPFETFLNEDYKVKTSFSFPDHHTYTKKDINRMVQNLEGGATLMTTEKDFVKLRTFKELESFNCCYIPIKIQFVEDEEHFLQMVDKSLKDYKLNR